MVRWQAYLEPALPAAQIPAPGHWQLNSMESFYTVEVTNTTNHCKSTGTFRINDDPYVISIPSADLTLTDLTDCAPANGSAQVTDVLVDGVSVWRKQADSHSTGYSVISHPFLHCRPHRYHAKPLDAGDYLATTLNTASNCESSPVSFKIAPADTTTGNYRTDSWLTTRAVYYNC